MTPNLINLPLGRASLTTFGLSLFLGFWVASFIFFRRAKEEFDNNERIIGLLIEIFFGWLVGARLSFFLANLSQFSQWSDIFLLWRQPGLSFGGGYWGIIIASFLWGKKNRFQIWKLADHALIPLLIFSLGFFFGQWLSGGGIFYLAGGGATLLSWAIAYWGLKSYRSLTWYPSGKIGFALLSTNSVFFGIMTLLAFFYLPGLYLETILNLVLFVWSITGLYLRSGSKSAKLTSQRITELITHDHQKNHQN